MNYLVLLGVFLLIGIIPCHVILNVTIENLVCIIITSIVIFGFCTSIIYWLHTKSFYKYGTGVLILLALVWIIIGTGFYSMSQHHYTPNNSIYNVTDYSTLVKSSIHYFQFYYPDTIAVPKVYGIFGMNDSFEGPSQKNKQFYYIVALMDKTVPEFKDLGIFYGLQAETIDDAERKIRELPQGFYGTRTQDLNYFLAVANLRHHFSDKIPYDLIPLIIEMPGTEEDSPNYLMGIIICYIAYCFILLMTLCCYVSKPDINH